MSDKFWMVFDVESLGLHGEGFAVGFVVVDAVTGEEVDSGIAYAHEDDSPGFASDREWIKANVVPALSEHVSRSRALVFEPGKTTARHVRDFFWNAWAYWKNNGARLAADVAWPVEARFLNACIDDDRRRRAWEGPYPLVDIASVRLARGLDPLGTEERHEDEIPAHNPLADARQSARLLLEALAVRA